MNIKMKKRTDGIEEKSGEKDKFKNMKEIREKKEGRERKKYN